MSRKVFDFYEFFAGGGMARFGLGKSWRCTFANDFDEKKAASYAANWGPGELRVDDVANLTTADLPGSPELVWASFPCQDLSLAGSGEGLKGRRSGTFWPFWELIKSLAKEGRAPKVIVLENVCGALTSHGGKDFQAISSALGKAGYRFGALVMNAVHFLPQSRPRLFIVGVLKSISLPSDALGSDSSEDWHPQALIKAQGNLPKTLQRNWIWWNLPHPPARDVALEDLIEDKPSGVKFHTSAETKRLLSLMNPLNLSKVAEAKKAGRRMVGTVYKRTRPNGPDGRRIQRAEVRFDGVAGCLRTPTGGSSRQTILIVDRAKVRSRLLSPREAARLMGLPDEYILPEKYNDAYHLSGDGLVVPVVKFLSEHLLEPVLRNAADVERAA